MNKTFNISKAAEIIGVSVKTLQRGIEKENL